MSGDTVTAGEALFLEVMKTEVSHVAPCDGKVMPTMAAPITASPGVGTSASDATFTMTPPRRMSGKAARQLLSVLTRQCRMIASNSDGGVR